MPDLFLDLAHANATFPTQLETVIKNTNHVTQLEKWQSKKKEVKAPNPLQRQIAYETNSNASLFSVVEGGVILGGGTQTFTKTQKYFRSQWKSGVVTGSLQRIKNDVLTQVSEWQRSQGMSYDAGSPEFGKLVTNVLLQMYLDGSMKHFKWMQDWWLLQGDAKSTIGQVTAITGTTVSFSWATTPMGNRIFDLGQEIQFYSPTAVQRTTGLTANSDGLLTSRVTQNVVKKSSNSNGDVVFNQVPTNLAVGDTAHFVNGYGMFPTGVPDQVEDTGNFRGTARVTKPELFNSIMNRKTGSPTLTPLDLFEHEAFMRTANNGQEQTMIEIFVNNAQAYNYAKNVYNTSTPYGIQRVLDYADTSGAGKINKVDYGSTHDNLFFNGTEMNVVDQVPPSEVYFLDLLTWDKIVNTPMKPYQFGSNQYLWQELSGSNPADKRRFTIFEEYENDLQCAYTQGRITGLGFDVKQVRF